MLMQKTTKYDQNELAVYAAFICEGLMQLKMQMGKGNLQRHTN